MYKTRCVRMRGCHASKYPDDRLMTKRLPANNWKEDTQKKVRNDRDVKSPTAEHQSLCSIFTFGGLRKDLFFFSLLFFPCAWKDLQLSTRPSRDSFIRFTYKQIHLRSFQKP